MRVNSFYASSTKIKEKKKNKLQLGCVCVCLSFLLNSSFSLLYCIWGLREAGTAFFSYEKRRVRTDTVIYFKIHTNIYYIDIVVNIT